MEIVTSIARVQDVMDASDQVVAKFGARGWWRGQGAFTWQLVPRVFRDDGGFERERELAIRFRAAAPSRHTNCPAANDLSGWLFLMQHFGLPTRLLDWSGSPLIAAYFAVRNKAAWDEPGALWALSPYRLNDYQTGKTGLPFGHPLAKYFAPPFRHDAEQNETVCAIHSTEIDVRMLVQCAMFTIHGTSTPMDDLHGAENFLVRLQIPASAKPVIFNQLDQLGISESVLFPDLEHLATDLTSKSYFEVGSVRTDQEDSPTR